MSEYSTLRHFFVERTVFCSRMIIYEAVKDARVRAGRSQQEVADYLGIERSTYAYYEAGRVRIPSEILDKVADYLGLPHGFYVIGNTKVLTFASDDDRLRAALRISLDPEAEESERKEFTLPEPICEPEPTFEPEFEPESEPGLSEYEEEPFDPYTEEADSNDLMKPPVISGAERIIVSPDGDPDAPPDTEIILFCLKEEETDDLSPDLFDGDEDAPAFDELFPDDEYDDPPTEEDEYAEIEPPVRSVREDLPPVRNRIVFPGETPEKAPFVPAEEPSRVIVCDSFPVEDTPASPEEPEAFPLPSNEPVAYNEYREQRILNDLGFDEIVPELSYLPKDTFPAKQHVTYTDEPLDEEEFVELEDWEAENAELESAFAEALVSEEYERETQVVPE